MSSKLNNLPIFFNSIFKGRKGFNKASFIIIVLVCLFVSPLISWAQVWNLKAPIPTGRWNSASVTLNNKIYVIGGSNAIGTYGIVEVYDPILNTWDVKTPLNTSRAEFGACVVNGKIYAIGGYNSINGALNSVEEYNPVTNTWVYKASMPIARSLLSAEVYNNKIYVVGGWPGTMNILQEYDPANNSWTTKAACPTSRNQINCFKAINDKLYFVGGKVSTNNQFFNTNEAYNPTTNSWSTCATLPNSLWSGSLTVLNNELHHIGGTNSQFYPNFNYHYIYNPVSNSWSNGLALPSKRSAHVSVTLNGKIYVIGGFDSVGNAKNTTFVLENCNNNIIQQDTISACGASVLITATNGLTNYQWSSGDTTASTNVTSTGWYTLTANDGNCTLTDSVFVSLVNANIQQNDTTICSGATLTLTVAQPTIGQTPCNASALPANLQNGLVGYWPFCGNANDESGNLNHGTVSGALISNDRYGSSNKAYYFNKANNSYIKTINYALANANNFSYSFWVKPDSNHVLPIEGSINNGSLNVVTNQCSLHPTHGSCYGNPSFNAGTGFCIGMNGIIVIEHSHNFVKASLVSSVNLNGWHHVVIVYNNKVPSLYVDGNYIKTGLGDTRNVYPSFGLDNTNYADYSQSGFGVGFNGANNSGYFFSGALDDFHIYNRSLSSNEIGQLFNISNISQSLSYLWSNGDTTATINVNPNQTTSYWVQVSNGITTCTDTIHITVNNVSNLIAQDTISACGSSITINATPNLNNYQWSNGSSAVSTNVTTTGWYKVTATNGVCTGTDSVFVSLVNANIQQNDTTICSGATLSLSVLQPIVAQTPCNTNALPSNLLTGLTAYWPFCGNANDESGNGYNGNSINATLTTDRFGLTNRCYSFNGNSAYINLPTNAGNIAGATKFSISYWVSTNGNINFPSQPIFAYWNSIGAPSGQSIGFYTTIQASKINSHFTAAQDVSSNLIINQGVWYHVVIIYDGTQPIASNRESLYINGQLIGLDFSCNCIIPPSIGQIGTYSRIGARHNNSYFNGKIDDMGIWNRALSFQEVQQLYTIGNQMPITYQWSTGDTTSTINVNPNQSTNYWVQVSNGITTCTDTIHVTVSNPNISIAVLPNDTLCAGQSLSLTANGASSYSWSGGVSNGQSFIPASSGIYTITATNALGCTATSSVGIIVNALPTVNANATPSAICFGSSAVLSAIGGTSYLWQPGNLIGSPSVSPSATTTYTVTATNAYGCSNTATRTVTVNSLPNINTSATPATICQGSSSVLGATGGTSYSWQPGNLIGTPSVSPTVTTIYTVTSTNASGCSNTATQTIVVNNLLSANASASPAVVCQGASSVLSAIGGTSYVWQPGNLTGSPSVSPLVTTTYTVTATNANGCTNTATVTVSVNSLPIIVPSASPSAICIGNTSTLSAIGGTSYVWHPGNLTASPIVSPTATTTYTVTATNANGCSNTNTVTVLVNNTLTVAGSATPSSICLSGSSVLSATGGTSYIWMPGNLSGSPTVSPPVNTTYTVTAINANGCSNTATVTITVNNLPTVASSATPTSICLGGSTILSATNGISYVWQPGNLGGSPSVSPSLTTTYTVTATNANGCTNTATVTVSVNSLPFIVPSASPSAICIGNSSTLSAIGGTSYVWQPGNLTASPTVSPTATTTYTVTATNANGCTNSSTVTVSVNGLPTIAASASPSAICIGNSTTLSAIGGANYVWQPGNLTASPSVSPTATTTYTVTGTNANGCSNTATVDVILNNLPTPSAAANPNSFCVGGSSVLSATGGTNYLWQPGNLNGAPTVSPTVNTVYTVTVSNANGCSATTTVSIAVNATPNVVIAGNPPSICIGTSYLLNATGASTYVWMPGNLGGTPTVTPLSTTTYSVTGTNANGCSNTTSITLTVNALPLVSANANPSAVCAGSSTSLSGNGGVAYVWMPGNLSGSPLVAPNTPTTYTVTATDNNGCSNTATVLIGVNALPNVTALAIPNEICNGGSANLQGNGASSYFWMPGNIFGAPMVFPNATTTYTVTGTAANGCSATATALLNVVAPPIITQQPSNQVSTNGSSAQFTIQSNNPNASYQWQVDNGFGFQNLTNGGQYSGVNTTTLNIANLTQANNGNLFRCQVSLPGCVVTSIQVILKVEFALGINTTSTQGIFGIYPNPATSTLHISTPAPYLGSTLELRDMSGRICYSTTLKQEEVSIPVASWARGVYMLHVQNEKGHWVYRVLLRE